MSKVAGSRNSEGSTLLLEYDLSLLNNKGPKCICEIEHYFLCMDTRGFGMTVKDT